MHPWLVFLKETGKRLSDIEYLAIKEFDGKLVEDEGFVTSAGDLATLTASAGKDLYLSSAKVVFFIDTVNNFSVADEVVLKINGTIKETAKASLALGNIEGTSTFEYEFKNIGQKVAATQIIKLEVITLDGDVSVEGYIQGFEENTGESPAV